MEKNSRATEPTLATRLAALQQHITTLRPGAGLIAVSKSHPAEVVAEAVQLGVMDFGENKVQEAQAKFPALKTAHPALRLHLIGPLQSNKAAEAVALFDVIHTIDRAKIADAVKHEAERQGKLPRCLIQVNIGNEPQKSGVAISELPALLAHCAQIGLPIDGLVCIPPANENPAPYFALLAKLADRHGLNERSMGMSGDYEVALRLGATMVRVGTALFGERQG